MAHAEGTPNWVDLQTPDIDRAREFYGSLFGWTADDLGPEAGGYVIFRKDGKQLGGGGPLQAEGAPPAWMTFFSVRDADATAARVGQAGGKVLMPPMDVADQGRMAVFADPAGAVWAVWQEGANQGWEIHNEVGAVGWNELMTPDMDTARAFYHATLGAGTTDMPGGMGYALLTIDNQPVAGMMTFTDDMPPMPPVWSIYFDVDDTDGTAALAEQLGGSISVPPTDSPAGRFAFLADPSGAQFGIITPDPAFQM
jgi:predicted enzyme related to lactoylglutathione lyase